MTEQEAKTKWCPFAQQIDWNFDCGRAGDEPQAISGAVNRGSADKPITFCLGSACMAWRWSNENRHMPLADDVGSVEEPQRPAHVPANYTWVPFDPNEGDPAGWLAPRAGFCGLAGNP